MRCKNCGWENPEGREICEKCCGSVYGISSVVNSSNPVSDRMIENVEEEETVTNLDMPYFLRKSYKCCNSVKDSSHFPMCRCELKNNYESSIVPTDNCESMSLLSRDNNDQNKNNINVMEDECKHIDIDDPKELIILNYGGKETKAKLYAFIEEDLENVWSIFDIYSLGVFIYLCLNIIGEGSVDILILLISLCVPIIMWLYGYKCIRRWNSIGKYAMYGVIYLFVFMFVCLITVTIITFTPLYVSDIINLMFRNPIRWQEYIIPIMMDFFFELFCILIMVIPLLFFICLLVKTLIQLKKGAILSPALLKYSNKKILPIIIEYIIPITTMIIYMINELY